jgi:hypothetical protein
LIWTLFAPEPSRIGTADPVHRSAGNCSRKYKTSTAHQEEGMKFTYFELMPWPYLPDDLREKHRSVWVDIDRTLYDPVKGHAEGELAKLRLRQPVTARPDFTRCVAARDPSPRGRGMQFCSLKEFPSV